MPIASAVAMVRPAAFQFNEETAANNFFPDLVQKNNPLLREKATEEFDAMVQLLRNTGIRVLVLEDETAPEKPDAIFPNNWFSCMDNRLTVFPLCAVNRRSEKRAGLIALLKKETGISEITDLGSYEKENMFLESTGSMVIDHRNRLIYACISARTNRELLQRFACDNNYEAMIFEAADAKGREIYHTNVLMCIGDAFAVVCPAAITESFRDIVLERLSGSGHELVIISFEQMNAFAGNMLQLTNDKKEKLLVMSSTAFNSLLPAQIEILEKHSRFIIPNVSVIESAAGGSVRCMMAELFY
ncbi:MAG: arginine deiminase-related protein [Ferruginibacter sp.]